MTKTRPLSEAYPELYAEWRDETDADSYLLRSEYRALWEGACGHQWRATIRSRTAGKGCPICSGNRVVAGINDLATTHPHLVSEWSPRNSRPIHEVPSGSSYLAAWVCAAQGHEYTSVVAHRASGARGCPVCSGRRTLPGFNDFATASPSMAEEFVRDAERKGRTPHTVGPSSHAKFVWRCAQGHEWVAEPAQRTAGMVCRVCRGVPSAPKQKKVVQRERSDRSSTAADASPLLVSEFVRDPEGRGRNPQNTARASKARLEWRCSVCGHEWVSRVSHRTNGQGCPACSGKVIVSGLNDLATKFPDIAAELDDPDYTAAELLPNSNLIVQWVCSEGHTWKARVFNRTRSNNGCNTCVRKEFSSVFERDILALVREALPETDIIPTARSIVKNRELDIYIPGLHLAIEANGVYWHTEQFGKTEHYHADKAENCVAQGIDLITIWEDDWKSRRPAAEAYLTAQLNGHVPDALHVKNIPLDEANAFVETTTLDEPVPENGSKTQPILALGAYEGETLVAVLIYRKTTEKALRIERYAASGRSSAYLDAFLQHAEETITGYDHILYYDNTERSYRPAFEELGFGVRNRIKPSYWFVKNTSRIPEATADTDGLQKAWDSGGTVFKRERQAGPKDSVAAMFPELVAEWRSATLSPETTLIGSGKKVEWECENGHTWTCPVYHRTKRGRTCPVCKKLKNS